MKYYRYNELPAEIKQTALMNFGAMFKEMMYNIYASKVSDTIEAIENDFGVEFAEGVVPKVRRVKIPRLNKVTGVRLYKKFVNLFWYNIYVRKIYTKGKKFRYSQVLYETGETLTGYPTDKYFTDYLIDYIRYGAPNIKSYAELIEKATKYWLSCVELEYQRETSFPKILSEIGDYLFNEQGEVSWSPVSSPSAALIINIRKED